VNEMDEDRRNWIIVIVLVIPLILIFLIIGPSYYETLTIGGKRVFMFVFQIVFLYTMGGLALRWLEGRHKVKDDITENVQSQTEPDSSLI
ncbi:MAG: hypothetical protein ACTSV2_06245, partial [Candidatus Thorarchaeota archaeon]